MPALTPVVEAVLKAWQGVSEPIAVLDRQGLAATRADSAVRHLRTVPGVGALTALAVVRAIGDPARFARSSSVGADLGLAPRRHQSGEVDRSGRLSKCGDPLVRSDLFEAASMMLNRVTRWSALKAWGTRLVKRVGYKKATVAVARKLAVILHRMWTDGTPLRWSTETAEATA